MRRLWLIPLVMLLALAYALLDGRSGISQARRLGGELEAAHGRIDALRARNDRLRQDATALRSDAFEQERLVRETLGLVRPGETVVRIPSERPETPRIP